MNKKYVIIFIIVGVVLLLLSSLYFVYAGLGFREYRSALKEISKLEGVEKTDAHDELFQDPKAGYYGGILGYADKKGSKLLVWTEKGSSIFELNDDVVYSSFRMCMPENLKSFREGGKFNMLLHPEDDYSDWYKRSHKGDFVVIVFYKGKISEVHVSDAWIFASMDLDKICK